jgi:hypothetical protein
MRTYGGVEVKQHAFLALTVDGSELSASHSSRFIPDEKAPRYPLDRRQAWSHNWSELGDEEKIFLPPTGNQTPVSSSP